MRRRALSSLTIWVIAVVFGAVRSAGADTRPGSFVVICPYSHRLPDDPILFPGQPGASHTHDFYANKTTKALSTLASMRAGDTTCNVDADTAGYWVPSANLGDSSPLPLRLRVYYLATLGQTVDDMPRGIQLLAGDRSATSPDDNPVVSWSCGAKPGAKTPISTHPYDCGYWARRLDFVDGVVGIITFPNCWDGAGLLPADVTDPVDGVCPVDFPDVLPIVSLRIHLGIMHPCNAGTTCKARDAADADIRLSLSSGAYYTLHADFWNTWQQHRLDAFTQRCLVEATRCKNPTK